MLVKTLMKMRKKKMRLVIIFFLEYRKIAIRTRASINFRGFQVRLILKSGLFLCSKNIDFAKKVRVIFKSGFYSRAGYNRDFTVHTYVSAM